MRLAWIVPGFQANAQDRCIPALTDLAHHVAEQHDLTILPFSIRAGKILIKLGG